MAETKMIRGREAKRTLQHTVLSVLAESRRKAAERNPKGDGRLTTAEIVNEIVKKYNVELSPEACENAIIGLGQRELVYILFGESRMSKMTGKFVKAMVIATNINSQGIMVEAQFGKLRAADPEVVGFDMGKSGIRMLLRTS